MYLSISGAIALFRASVVHGCCVVVCTLNTESLSSARTRNKLCITRRRAHSYLNCTNECNYSRPKIGALLSRRARAILRRRLVSRKVALNAQRAQRGNSTFVPQSRPVAVATIATFEQLADDAVSSALLCSACCGLCGTPRNT